jgi:phosphopantetheine--protein transferase-like protein
MQYNQIEIGVDLVSVEQFDYFVKAVGYRFLERAFTTYEVETALERPSPIQSLASIFSLKEAVIKSLPNTPLTLVDMPLIEIKRRKDSSLKVSLPDHIEYTVSGSVAHKGRYAIGVAVAFSESQDSA